MSRARAVWLLKFAVLAAMVALLASHVDLRETQRTMARVRLDWVAAAYLVLVAQLVVASQRWMILLRLNGVPARGARYFAYFGMGSITNLVLPGGVAGDFFRMWQVSREGLKIESAANAMLLDRMVALATLGVLVTISVLAQAAWTRSMDSPMAIPSLIVGLCIVGGVVLIALAKPAVDRLAGRRWLSILPALSQSTRELLTHRSAGGGWLLVVALAGHVLLVLAALCLAAAFGISIGFGDAMVVFPMVFLVSSVPITPGGWGVREAAMIVALAPFSASAEASTGLSVTHGILAMIACLPAALLYLAIRDDRRQL